MEREEPMPVFVIDLDPEDEPTEEIPEIVVEPAPTPAPPPNNRFPELELAVV